MKKILSIALVVLSLLFVTSCEKPLSAEEIARGEFSDKATQYGVYNSSKAIFVFNVNEHQVAKSGSATNYLYRIQTDNQNKFVSVKCSSLPSVVDSSVDVIVDSNISEITPKTYSMKLIKVGTTKAWLWNETAMFGIIVERP